MIGTPAVIWDFCGDYTLDMPACGQSLSLITKVRIKSHDSQGFWFGNEL